MNIWRYCLCSKPTAATWGECKRFHDDCTIVSTSRAVVCV